MLEGANKGHLHFFLKEDFNYSGIDWDIWIGDRTVTKNKSF